MRLCFQNDPNCELMAPHPWAQAYCPHAVGTLRIIPQCHVLVVQHWQSGVAEASKTSCEPRIVCVAVPGLGCLTMGYASGYAVPHKLDMQEKHTKSMYIYKYYYFLKNTIIPSLL